MGRCSRDVWDARPLPKEPGGERGDGVDATSEHPVTAERQTHPVQERHLAGGAHPSSHPPPGGDRESLRRRQRELPVPDSPGRQFRDYLLQGPRGADGWGARLCAPEEAREGGSRRPCRRKPCAVRAPRDGDPGAWWGKQSGGKGARARKFYYKEPSRTTEGHVIAEPSRGPGGGACRRVRSVRESPPPQGRLQCLPRPLDWRHFLESTCSPEMGRSPSS